MIRTVTLLSNESLEVIKLHEVGRLYSVNVENSANLEQPPITGLSAENEAICHCEIDNEDSLAQLASLKSL